MKQEMMPLNLHVVQGSTAVSSQYLLALQISAGENRIRFNIFYSGSELNKFTVILSWDVKISKEHILRNLPSYLFRKFFNRCCTAFIWFFFRAYWISDLNFKEPVVCTYMSCSVMIDSLQPYPASDLSVWTSWDDKPVTNPVSISFSIDTADSLPLSYPVLPRRS